MPAPPSRILEAAKHRYSTNAKPQNRSPREPPSRGCESLDVFEEDSVYAVMLYLTGQDQGLEFIYVQV